MCGFVGFTAAAPDRALLARMTARLAHRGPDGEGLHVEAGVALGHRRLAVIDLVASRQPMTAGPVTLAFNGEIYNFTALRRELAAAGLEFRTQGDTEVILNGYRHWGVEVIPRLRGIFAFALYDGERGRLVLARDHVGTKPLYLADLPGGDLAFASEPKALLEHPAVDRSVDLDALGRFCERQFLPGIPSVWKGIRRLPPGHALVIEDGRNDLRCFWKPGFEPKRPLADPERAVADLLDEAVREQLVADVPVGCFLSGGVDSSLILALMTKHRGPCDAFTIAFAGEAGGDGEASVAVAQRLGARHHVHTVTPADVLAEVEDLPALFDEPFADHAALPTRILARAARERVTVVLSGEGADEVFAGYGSWLKRARTLQRTAALAPLTAPLLRHLPWRWRKEALVEALSRTGLRRYGGMPAQIRADQQSEAFTPAFRAACRRSARDLAEDTLRGSDAVHWLDRITAVDMAGWLDADLLAKVDRTTMACGLEARVPFLDHRLADLVLHLPVDQRIRPGEPKDLLKRLAERHVGADIVRRPKRGFFMPMDRWLANELAPLLRQHLLAEDGLIGRGLLHRDWLTTLVERHTSGRKAKGTQLWVLLQLELWCKRFAEDLRLR